MIIRSFKDTIINVGVFYFLNQIHKINVNGGRGFKFTGPWVLQTDINSSHPIIPVIDYPRPLLRRDPIFLYG